MHVKRHVVRHLARADVANKSDLGHLRCNQHTFNLAQQPCQPFRPLRLSGSVHDQILPDLDAGVYAYARAGFGPYVGFFSAFGYWASACVGNVSYWILIKSTLGASFPALGQGNTLTAVLISSVGIWAFHFLVLRGVKEAAGINAIVITKQASGTAKIDPLMAAFNAVAWMSANPASSQPSICVI